MGDQADLIINGDCCEVCGENFDDEGNGFPRRYSACKGMPQASRNPIKEDRLKKAAKVLKNAGLTWEEFNNGYHKIAC